MKESVLITAIGSMSAKLVISSLKNNYTVIGCDIYEKRWVANSNDVDYFYQVPKYNDCDYIDYLIKICKEHNINYLIPLTDYEIDVLNLNRNIFKENNVVLCMSSKKSIDICRDKKELFSHLSKYNSTYLIYSDYLCNIDIDKIKFPLVIKPIDGRSSQGLKIVSNKEELNDVLSITDLKTNIYQEYIKGNIVTCDVCRNEKTKKVISVSREELLRTYNGAGLSIKIFNDEVLNVIVEEIADKLNINGCVNFEFIKSLNGYKFLECNPRFSGGVAFSCLAGYDFINNSLNVFKGIEIEDKKNIKESYIAKRYEEVVL